MSGPSERSNRLRDEESVITEPDDGNVLLDVEAAESDGWQDGEADEAEIVPFYPFLRLPLELRIRIWQMFCPDLASNARVLEFDLSPSSAALAHKPGRPKRLRNCITAKEGLTLEGQTLPLRTLLAVHGETRSLALKAYPETLFIDITPHSIVSFNSDKDVVLIKGHRGPKRQFDFPEFAHKVKQLAVAMDDFDKNKFPSLLRHFTNLKRVFFVGAESDFKRRDLQWTGSEYLNSYQLTSHDDLFGFRQNVGEVLIWPDVDKRPDWSRTEVPRLHTKFVQEEIIQAVEKRGLEHYLMVSFEPWNLVPRYKEPKPAPGNWQAAFSDLDPLTSESESESESEPPSDHYESDGIDDEEIVEEDEPSEDELFPDAISPGSLAGYDEIDNGAPGTTAHFSSMEPDSAGEDENESVAASGVPLRGRKRRVVSDSDDDEDAQAEPPAKRSRTTRVALNLDDEEEGGPGHQAGGTRQAPAVLSDSETDDGGAGASATRPRVVQDSSEDDESEEEDAPPRTMTLAERLQRFRDENPVPGPEDGGSSHKSYDSDGNSLMPESDEDDEDDEEDSEDGLVDGMAEDSNGEGEDGSEEGW